MSQQVSLSNYIYTSCISHLNQPIESKTHHAGRNGLKCITFFFGLAGSLPSIPIAMKFGGSNRLAGVVFATSNVTSYTSLLTWSYHNMIDYEMNPTAPMTRSLEQRIGLLTRVAIKGAIVIMGVSSQAPRAYLAYAYNNNSVGAAVLVLATVSALPMFSLDLSARAILQRRHHRTEFEKKLLQSKGILKERIRGYRDYIKKSANNGFAQQTRAINTDEKQQVENFLEEICNQGVPKQETTYQKTAKLSSLGFGVVAGSISTFAQLAYGFWLTKNIAEVMEDESWFEYSVASFVVLCNFYLTTMVSFGSCFSLSHKLMTNPLQIIRGDSLSSQLRKKTRTALGLGLLTISGLSLGPLLQTIEDYFDGPFEDFMMVATPPGIFFMFITAMETIANTITNSSIMHFGEEAEKEILRLDVVLERLSDTIDRCSPEKYSEFLLQLDDSLFDNFAKKGANSFISKTEIMGYLAGQEQADETTSLITGKEEVPDMV